MNVKEKGEIELKLDFKLGGVTLCGRLINKSVLLESLEEVLKREYYLFSYNQVDQIDMKDSLGNIVDFRTDDENCVFIKIKMFDSQLARTFKRLINECKFLISFYAYFIYEDEQIKKVLIKHFYIKPKDDFNKIYCRRTL